MPNAIESTKLKAIQVMPSINSVDKDWIGWIDFIVSKYGSGLGKQMFVDAWQKRGSRAANTRTIRTHLKSSYNIEIDENIWDNIVDKGGDLGDSISNVLKVGKYVTIAVGVIVLGGLAMIVFNIGKDPIRAAGTAAKFIK